MLRVPRVWMCAQRRDACRLHTCCVSQVCRLRPMVLGTSAASGLGGTGKAGATEVMESGTPSSCRQHRSEGCCCGVGGAGPKNTSTGLNSVGPGLAGKGSRIPEPGPPVSCTLGAEVPGLGDHHIPALQGVLGVSVLPCASGAQQAAGAEGSVPRVLQPRRPAACTGRHTDCTGEWGKGGGMAAFCRVQRAPATGPKGTLQGSVGPAPGQREGTSRWWGQSWLGRCGAQGQAGGSRAAAPWEAPGSAGGTAGACRTGKMPRGPGPQGAPPAPRLEAAAAPGPERGLFPAACRRAAKQSRRACSALPPPR